MLQKEFQRGISVLEKYNFNYDVLSFLNKKNIMKKEGEKWILMDKIYQL
jgi:hypothetical protein